MLRYLLFALLCLLSCTPAAEMPVDPPTGDEFSLLSWNIRDFGKTKNAAEIASIADIVSDYDIVAIQEVVAGPGGAQAVARLAVALDRTGSDWDYAVSDPTDSPPYKTERYAFLWKPSRVKMMGRPWLEKDLVEEVFREPFMGRFALGGETLLVLNYHSRRFDEQPEREVKHFKYLPAKYPDDILLIAGDFNMPQTHTVFNPLKKMGYKPLLVDRPTTLKTKCEAGTGNYFNYPIDNIFFPTHQLGLESSGIIDHVGNCDYLDTARLISDHVPVVGAFQLP